MSGRLDGRVAIVTGAGDGIGNGIARRFAQEGAKVVVAEIDASLGSKVADQLRDEFGAEAVALSTDVTDKASLLGMIAATVDRFGTVDILVNNAWSRFELQRFENKTEEQFDRAFQFGPYAALRSMRAVFPVMRQKGYGRIINICSISGVDAHMGSSEYNAAKEAMRTITRTVAREWARYGIVANAICPGAKTGAARATFAVHPELEAVFEGQNPMGRLGDPENDIAPVALFLASEDARYLTGNTLFADGGNHLSPGWSPELPD